MKFLVIGNGPSLTKEQIFEYREYGYQLIVCNYYNKMIEKENDMRLYPEYYCITDNVYFRDNGIEIFERLPDTTFVLGMEAYKYIMENFSDIKIRKMRIVKVNLQENIKSIEDKFRGYLNQIDFDPTFKTTENANNTILQLSIPLAVYLKAENIILIGNDLNNSYLHFYDSDKKSIEKRNQEWEKLWKSVPGYTKAPYPKPIDYPENVHKMNEKCWEKVKEILEKKDIRIYNNTPGSRLKMFEKSELWDKRIEK